MDEIDSCLLLEILFSRNILNINHKHGQMQVVVVGGERSRGVEGVEVVKGSQRVIFSADRSSHHIDVCVCMCVLCVQVQVYVCVHTCNAHYSPRYNTPHTHISARSLRHSSERAVFGGWGAGLSYRCNISQTRLYKY